MLLQRIITAVILIPLVVSAVYLLPIEYFTLLVGLIMVLAAWEWTNLIGLHSLWAKIVFQLLLIIPMLGIYFWTYILEFLAFSFDQNEIRSYSGVLEWGVIAPVLFWLGIMLLIRKSPDNFLKLQLKTFYKALTGWFVLLAAWMFLCRLRTFFSADMAMYFLILIWCADIAAYFVGKKYGSTKLSPNISPGKTVAGFYGALASAAVCGVALVLIYGFPMLIAADFILLSVLTVLLSIYGDLFFSLVKRQQGVKDSGFIFPGHGGVLDRIDSMIAAIPFFYAGVILIWGSLK